MSVAVAAAPGAVPAVGCINPPLPDRLYAAVVVRIVDGDTIDVLSGKRLRVRLIGIDTPEVHDGAKLNRDAQQSGRSRETIKALGRLSSEYTRRHLLGEQVALELDVETRDRYGRLLAYVWLQDGTFFNMAIVRDGFAVVSTYPPNVKYVEILLACQREAREEERGLWGR